MGVGETQEQTRGRSPARTRGGRRPNTPCLNPFSCVTPLPIGHQHRARRPLPRTASRGTARLYHEEKAKGGRADHHGGSTTSPRQPFCLRPARRRGRGSWFRRLTDGVGSQGAAVMCQITHMVAGARSARWPVTWGRRNPQRAHRLSRLELEDMGASCSVAEAAADASKAGSTVLNCSPTRTCWGVPRRGQPAEHYGGILENRLRTPGAGGGSGCRRNYCRNAVTGTNSRKAACPPMNRQGAQYLEQSGSVDFLNILAGAPTMIWVWRAGCAHGDAGGGLHHRRQPHSAGRRSAHPARGRHGRCRHRPARGQRRACRPRRRGPRALPTRIWLPSYSAVKAASDPASGWVTASTRSIGQGRGLWTQRRHRTRSATPPLSQEIRTQA